MDSGGDARGGGSASVEFKEGSEAGAVLDVAGVEVEGWVSVGGETLVLVILGSEDADAVKDLNVGVGHIVDDNDSAAKEGLS